ncbi:hypothetical protein AKO1_005393, partial [Acrasis kona]
MQSIVSNYLGYNIKYLMYKNLPQFHCCHRRCCLDSHFHCYSNLMQKSISKLVTIQIIIFKLNNCCRVTISSVQYEESIGIKRADQKITFDYMNTIVVEHGANISYTADNQSYSMSQHYEKALDYHKKINPEQTWLVNWTTNDTVWRPNEFHDVNVMIIHHDQSFGSFTIKTIDRNQEAPIISVVEVSANEYKYKQENNNNLEATKPKMGGGASKRFDPKTIDVNQLFEMLNKNNKLQGVADAMKSADIDGEGFV